MAQKALLFLTMASSFFIVPTISTSHEQPLIKCEWLFKKANQRYLKKLETTVLEAMKKLSEKEKTEIRDDYYAFIGKIKNHKELTKENSQIMAFRSALEGTVKERKTKTAKGTVTDPGTADLYLDTVVGCKEVCLGHYGHLDNKEETMCKALGSQPEKFLLRVGLSGNKRKLSTCVQFFKPQSCPLSNRESMPCQEKMAGMVKSAIQKLPMDVNKAFAKDYYKFFEDLEKDLAKGLSWYHGKAARTLYQQKKQFKADLDVKVDQKIFTGTSRQYLDTLVGCDQVCRGLHDALDSEENTLCDGLGNGKKMRDYLHKFGIQPKEKPAAAAAAVHAEKTKQDGKAKVHPNPAVLTRANSNNQNHA